MKHITFLSKSLHKSNGQSLIEILIATLVVGTVVTGIALALTYSVKNTAESRYREFAGSMGQEVIEFFRSERTRVGWTAFNTALSAGTSYCLETIPVALSGLPATGACGDDDTFAFSGATFSREVSITKPNNAIRLEVTIEWYQDPTDVHEVTLVQELRES